MGLAVAVEVPAAGTRERLAEFVAVWGVKTLFTPWDHTDLQAKRDADARQE
jgi:hypothetical protein